MKRKIGTYARVYAEILANIYNERGYRGEIRDVARAARHLSLSVKVNPRELRKAVGMAEEIALALRVESVRSFRHAGSVVYQIQLPEDMWEQYTRADVTGLGVGLAERRVQVDFSLDVPHVLIAGATNSGKTEAMKAGIFALADTTPPSKMQFIMIDSNDQFPDFGGLAHLAIPIANTAAHSSNAIMYARRELAHRQKKSIQGGRKLVIAIDEIDNLIRLPGAVDNIKIIATQGRKYGVHLVIGSQRPTQKKLPDILDNLLNRYIGAVDSAYTSSYLTGHAGLEAHKLTGAGDFLHISGGKAVRFQVAQVLKNDYARLPRRNVKYIDASGNRPRIVRAAARTANPSAVAAVMHSPQVGRPPAQMKPKVLAAYMMNEKLSAAMAKRFLGLGRRVHEKYKKFATELKTEMDNIEKAATR